MARSNFPFADIAKQALLSSETLVTRWLPGGTKAGPEYKVINPLRADNKPGSFSINLDTGKWGDFATDKTGLDLISLYAYLEGIEQMDAAIDVADQIYFKLPDEFTKHRPAEERQKPVIDPESVKNKKIKEPSPWRPITPVPDNAPPPHTAHQFRGIPERVWCYRDAQGKALGYIYRFATSDGGKETIPHVYCRNEKTGAHDWQWLQWPEPRPLYGLDRLAAKPNAWVLLVEGEKCADAPVELLEHAVIVSWPGGSKGVGKVDWSPLAGRNIYAWADCDAQRDKLTKDEKAAGIDPMSKPLLPEEDQPGMKAMLQIRAKLVDLDPTTKFKLVDIPAPGAKPEGWDVADAIEEGMDAAALSAFIMNTRPHLHAVDGSGKTAAPKQPDTPNSASAEEEEKPRWYQMLLRKNHELVPCLANAYDILANDDKWQGVLAFDEFGQRVVKLKKPPYFEKNGTIGEWDAQDDARTAMWITRAYRLNISPALAAEAVENLARNNTINPPRDWLKGLKWDGVKRVDTWMHDYMGVAVNDYTKRVARWFMMGMVKRVFEPGCQFDYCLVLEGPQGRKKSSAFAVLGGEWFGDTDLDLHNKDSMSALRGKMLYEFSEMGSVAKAEATRQKSFLTRRIDEYRPVYGRREIRLPRSVVFCGTTNEWEWNKDPTGGRRFWPIEVTQLIDVDGLKAVREQLFAEAVKMVEEGLRCYPTPDEQTKLFDPEQLRRIVQESLVDALYDHVINYNAEFSLYFAATEWLKIDAAKLSRDIQTRIGIALRQLGCTKVEKKTHVNRSWYKPPFRNEAASKERGDPAQQGDDDEILF
jgi:putative DNA primase/helicase